MQEPSGLMMLKMNAAALYSRGVPSLLIMRPETVYPAAFAKDVANDTIHMNKANVLNDFIPPIFSGGS